MNGTFSPTEAGSSADRLGFALFLALALHALVIFGLGFSVPPPETPAPSLEITLAHHRSETTPKEADYLAAHNQQGSGSEQRPRPITTDRLAQLESSELRETQPLAPPPSRRARPTTAQPVVSARRMDAPASAEAEQARSGMAADTPVTPQLRREIASLRARLDQKQQEYSRMPRVLRLTSASTKAADHAEYLRQWVEWVEEVGNRNYPAEARARSLYGDLALAVTLTRDGSVAGVEILRSSGHRLLDLAAVRIVRLAAPFPPIPPRIEADRLEIIRTWRFIPGNQFATEAR